MNYRRILIAAVFILYIQWKKTVKNVTSWRHKTLSASANRKQVSRCWIHFPHELTCQILTNQSIKIGRRAWPTRDHGKKRSSPPVFLNNWLNFRVRGKFEVKFLIVLGHSDINKTYFIYIFKTQTWACDHLKSSNLSADNFKKHSNSVGRYLSPRYGQAILVSRNTILTAVN